MKAILGFTRMSVRGIQKVKPELGFALMASNMRKIAAHRTTLLLENEKQWLLLKFITINHCFF